MLKINNLVSGYGPIEVCHSVSLQVEEGEIVTIVGANGAGKSTLLRTISGLNKATSGKITFCGTDITAASPPEIVRKGLVQVSEMRGIFTPMSVEENLRLGFYGMGGALSSQQKAERLDSVFSLFPVLKKRLQQRAGTLSGGERQMLALARVLIMSPKLLMLDEPSLGLAPLVVEELFNVIRKLNKQGLTILLVEQNVDLALEAADRAYVMDVGRFTVEGSARELLKDERIQAAYLGQL
ncbi:MAG: ABC transporter ATP-binding protein [Eubacteriales bacterium]